MNIFNNLKVNLKILLGFLIILGLMGIIGGIAIFQVTKINATVTDLADNLANDQHLADKIVSKILLVRFYANKYIRQQKAKDLNRFKDEFVYFEKLLAEADKEINKPERIKMLAQIREGVQAYGQYFKEVTQLMDKRSQILSEVLDVQGPQTEKKLEQLRESAFKADDSIAAFYAANFQRALLLMRLDAFKYLQEGDPQWSEKFGDRYQEAQIAFHKLEEELQDPTRRQLAQKAQEAIKLYHKSFMGLQTGYVRQNQIIETQLNVIGPSIRKIASKMSESVSTDFNQANQTTQTLVNRTWLELLITMIFAILVGLGLGFLIARSITYPLKIMIEMSKQMSIGNIGQLVATQNSDNLNQIMARRDEMGEIVRVFDTLANYFKTVIEDIVQVSQGLAQGNLQVVPQVKYKGDFIQIKNALEVALSDIKQVIEDIVQISQELAVGNLRIRPKAEYRGDFANIKTALVTASTDLTQVIEDIVQVSKGLAEGSQRITAKAEYRGDFVQVKDALETASANLAEAMAINAIQDWLKTGQAQLNEQIRGEQDIMTLGKNVITFLTTYLEAQVGVFYVLEAKEKKKEHETQTPNELEKNNENSYLKLIASYAYTQRKGLSNEFQIGEGLIGQAALEKQRIIITDVPSDYISIQSGLGEAIPLNLVVTPFMYEKQIKGVIEIGSFHEITEVQLELLEQVMPIIGITINTAESRAKMQELLSTEV
jgi:methyl-accepting chemotaxis protein